MDVVAVRSNFNNVNLPNCIAMTDSILGLLFPMSKPDYCRVNSCCSSVCMSVGAILKTDSCCICQLLVMQSVLWQQSNNSSYI